MIRWLRRYRNFLWISVTLAMLLSIVGAGGFLFTSKDTSDAVAMVGGVKIPYPYYRRLLDSNMEQLRKEKKDVSDDLAKDLKREVLQSLVTNEMSAQEGISLGLRVTDEELASVIQRDPLFQNEGVFNRGLYAQVVLNGFNTTIEDYEQRRRRELAAVKYQSIVFNRVKILPEEIREEYKLSHNGSDKNFEKDRQEFVSNLYRIRSLSTLQTALRKAVGRMDVRSFLDDRDPGGA